MGGRTSIDQACTLNGFYTSGRASMNKTEIMNDRKGGMNGNIH
jgi:hypothetical protein